MKKQKIYKSICDLTGREVTYIVDERLNNYDERSFAPEKFARGEKFLKEHSKALKELEKKHAND